MLYAEPIKINVKGYKNDDCTIVAMGNGLGISYDLARRIMLNMFPSKNGLTIRTNQRTKTEMQDTLEAYKLAEALSSEKIDYTLAAKRGHIKRPPTVDKFAEDHPEGSYLVFIEGHMLAVILGSAVDVSDSSWERVERAYKVDFSKADEELLKICDAFNLDPDIHIMKEITHYKL